MFPDVARPFIPADHVKTDIGTGLVHTSYAHGFHDYEMSVRRGDEVYCYVDEEGRYSRHLGYELEGKFVLEDGQLAVLKKLKKHVIHAYPYIHSYPYDWRTNKPVIIRSSAQWFIDISALGVKAAELLDGSRLQVGTASADLRHSLISVIKNRSAWCISRQRCWGVPIPVLFKDDGSPILSEKLIVYLANNVEKKGPNIWWDLDVESLFPENILKENGLSECRNIEKGKDVMDVWIDSGLAWGCSDNDSTPADLLIEGVDQFRGWFQSLLLTSLALKDQIPFKRILVHGFAVDEDGKKMSKSVGNVVDPNMIIDGSLRTKALGIDGLRLWVALYGSEGNQAKIGTEIIKEIENTINHIRSSLRFLLGSVYGLKDEHHGPSPYFIDRHILYETNEFVKRCKENLKTYRFRLVTNDFIQFLQRPLSSNYIQFVKDRLYCGCKADREYAQKTLSAVGIRLVASMAPILPHLATEFFMFHPCINDPASALRDCQDYISHELGDVDGEFLELVTLIGRIRSELNKASTGVDTSKDGVILNCGKEITRKLRNLQADECSFSSELVEALKVSMVVLKEKDIPEFTLHLTPSPKLHCARCRKQRRDEGEAYCPHCTNAIEEASI